MGLLTSFLAFALTTFGPGAALYIACAGLRLMWPHARPFARVGPVDVPMQRFLHATKGKPAWALIAGATNPIGKALCLELASRGFNIVLYGRGDNAAANLTVLRSQLAKMYPENKYRIAVADVNTTAGAAKQFAARVAASLRDVNLTVLVSNMGMDKSGVAAARYLTAAVSPLLKRNAPALLVDVDPPVAISVGASTYSFCDASLTPLCSGVDFMACRLGEFAAGGCAGPSVLRPAPAVLARAVLLRAGCAGGGGKSGIVNPYWPHALLRMVQLALPVWVTGRISFADRGFLARIRVGGMR